MEYQNVQYHELPQPSELTLREKEDAMGAYLMMFAAIAGGIPLPLLNVVAAIIYYHINKKKSKFVHFHVHQSLWSQMPISILNAGVIFWTARIFFFDYDFTREYKSLIIVVLACNALYITFSLIAAFRARKGRFFYFVFFGRWAYHIAFKKCETESHFQGKVNLPPM